LVIAAFAYPLMVKLRLTEDESYTLSDRELEAGEAIDQLLDSSRGNGWKKPAEWPNILSRAEGHREFLANIMRSIEDEKRQRSSACNVDGIVTPDQDRRAPLRRPDISFSQGAEWKALISKYIGTIPLSGDASCAAEQSISGAPPPRTAVSSAMMAKVGAAARHSQSAAPSKCAWPLLRWIAPLADPPV
jgi:hypothetical protein